MHGARGNWSTLSISPTRLVSRLCMTSLLFRKGGRCVARLYFGNRTPVAPPCAALKSVPFPVVFAKIFTNFSPSNRSVERVLYSQNSSTTPTALFLYFVFLVRRFSLSHAFTDIRLIGHYTLDRTLKEASDCNSVPKIVPVLWKHFLEQGYTGRSCHMLHKNFNFLLI